MTDHQDWEEPVEWRIGRLEESQRRLRGWVIGLSVMLVGLFFYSSRPPQPLPDVIRAREFRVVDTEGVTKGLFSNDRYGTRIQVSDDERGGSIAMQVLNNEGPRFRYWGRGNGLLAFLEVDDEGRLMFRMTGRGEDAGYLALLLDEEAESSVSMGRFGGWQQAQLFQGAGGSGLYVAHNEEKEGEASLLVEADGNPTLYYRDNDQTTMQLRRWGEGNTGLYLYGENQERDVSLQALGGGSSSLRLDWDWVDGSPQSSISLGDSGVWGGPHLTLAENAEGKATALHAGGETGSFMGIYEKGLDWTVIFPEGLLTEEMPAEEGEAPAPTPAEE